MNKWEIVLTRDAADDIRNIYHYIAQQLFAPETAKEQINRIMKGIHSLEMMPFRCPLYEEEPWHSRGLRYYSVNRYLVFYLPNEMKNEVVIFHVFYSGRNIDELLSI